MKTNLLKSVFLTALVAGSLTSCVNDDDYSTPDLECNGASYHKTMEVADVPAPVVVAQYTENDTIEAYVTSSDEGGNFFKTISFQTFDAANPDAQPVGFSISVDATSTFVNYEPGRKVFVALKGLYTDAYNDGTRIGGLYVNTSGEASVGRLPESQIAGAVLRSCSAVNEDDLARPMTITEALNDDNLNTLIDLQGVQFSEDALGKNYYDSNNDIGGATNHYLTDISGNTVIFRTSSFSNFAGRPVASGSGTVRGVLTKFGDDYQFMARTIRDIELTGGRFSAFYTENFQSATDGTDLNIPGWTNVAVSGTKKWKEEVFSGNGYAEFSSFGTGQALNVGWLVSPGINMDEHTGETLVFRTAQHHLDVDQEENSLHVYVSTDFTGNPATATWTEVSVNLPTKDTAWYQFVGSGAVDLSSYTGTLYVGFKFTGSGSNTALDGAFQIDDLKVYGGN